MEGTNTRTPEVGDGEQGKRGVSEGGEARHWGVDGSMSCRERLVWPLPGANS